jgi:hypothetical protein
MYYITIMYYITNSIRTVTNLQILIYIHEVVIKKLYYALATSLVMHACIMFNKTVNMTLRPVLFVEFWSRRMQFKQ